jgi:hypothetical protein
MFDGDSWVQLGGDGAMIALRAGGKRGFEFPADIRFKAGRIEGERTVGLWAVDEFASALEQMHRTLGGSASLNTYEDDFRIAATMERLGHVGVSVSIAEHLGGPVEFDFNYRFEVDQSYLPAFITGLRKQFPGPLSSQ